MYDLLTNIKIFITITSPKCHYSVITYGSLYKDLKFSTVLYCSPITNPFDHIIKYANGTLDFDNISAFGRYPISANAATLFKTI